MSRGKFVYKDQSSRDKILAIYDRAMESLNVHYREEYIETSYGTTHIVIAGDETKPPVFTVHGGNGITPLNLKLFLPLLSEYCLFTKRGKETRIQLQFALAIVELKYYFKIESPTCQRRN